MPDQIFIKKLKKRIKKTWLYPFLKKIPQQLSRNRFKHSPPYQVEYEEIVTYFNTNDPYSNNWFFPRYSNGKLHEPEATRIFIDESLRANVVVDVGSNLGWFTCIAANQNKNAKVYSFELDSVNYKICKNNIKLNGLKNVSLHQVAVTNHDGEITYNKDSMVQASPCHRLGRQGVISCKAKALKLDTFFSNIGHPEVVKIDVEGAEQLVIEGMRNILYGNTLRSVLIEIHPMLIKELGGRVSGICNLLEDAGFSIRSIQHRSNTENEASVDLSEIESIGTGGRMFLARRT